MSCLLPAFEKPSKHCVLKLESITVILGLNLKNVVDVAVPCQGLGEAWGSWGTPGAAAGGLSTCTVWGCLLPADGGLARCRAFVQRDVCLTSAAILRRSLLLYSSVFILLSLKKPLKYVELRFR